MLKNKLLGVGFVGAVLVMLAIGVFAFSFQAHAAPSSVSAKTVHAYIISTKTGDVFKRTAITVSLKDTFVFTNETKASRTVTSNGKTVATVASKASTPYTFTAAGTYVFGLAVNKAATLTVTVK